MENQDIVSDVKELNDNLEKLFVYYVSTAPSYLYAYDELDSLALTIMEMTKRVKMNKRMEELHARTSGDFNEVMLDKAGELNLNKLTSEASKYAKSKLPDGTSNLDVMRILSSVTVYELMKKGFHEESINLILLVQRLIPEFAGDMIEPLVGKDFVEKLITDYLIFFSALTLDISAASHVQVGNIHVLEDQEGFFDQKETISKIPIADPSLMN